MLYTLKLKVCYKPENTKIYFISLILKDKFKFYSHFNRNIRIYVDKFNYKSSL